MISRLFYFFLILISSVYIRGSEAAYYILEDPHLRKSFNEAVVAISGKDLKQDSDIRMRNIGIGMSKDRKVLLEIDGIKYFMKIFGKPDQEKIRNEIKAHTYASSIGIAPQLIYVDKDLQFVIMPYIEGHTLSTQDLDDKKIIKKLGQYIRKLQEHDGNLELYRPQVWRAKKHYEKIQKKDIAVPSVYPSLYESYYQEGISLNKDSLVLSHGDLNPTNIVITKGGRIYILDWSSATFDNKYADLGYLSFLNGFNDMQSRLFMKSYLKAEPTESELSSLKNAKRRTSFLTATVWFDFSEGDGDKLLPMQKRVERLDSSLDSPNLKTGVEYVHSHEIVPVTADPTAVKLYALGFLKTYINWLVN